MGADYDVIVVGARCAGAPLAHFLARAGKRVLLVDAQALPRDQPMSTHFIQPYGMRVIDELGLGARVREVAPSVDRFHNGIEDTRIWLEFPAGQGGSCPRRMDLDAILLDGARAAGAEVRVRCKVVDVLREGERVRGVVVDEDGARREISADAVVGADGRNSTVARLVGAEEYNGYDGPRFAYWNYWPRPAWYDSDPRYRGAALIVYDGADMRLCFPTNRDQLLIGVAAPLGPDVERWRAEPQACLEEKLRPHPLMGPLIDAEPLGKPIGAIKLRYFFRRAAGPGWALVGDAGLFKDPSPGLGITDALRDARALSSAIIEGGDAALERYWRQRDIDSLELFYLARDLGDLDYNNPFNKMVFTKLARREDLRQRMIEIVERRLAPSKAFGVGQIIGWTLLALLRGRFGVLGPFFQGGKRAGEVKRQMRERQKLLGTAAPVTIGSAPSPSGSEVTA